MFKLALFLVFTIPCLAQSALTWSQIGLGAGNNLDIASSYGKYELNPILGNGEFGAKQTAIKESMIAALVVGEYFIVRDHPKFRKPLTIVNWVAAGIFSGEATSNWIRNH